MEPTTQSGERTWRRGAVFAAGAVVAGVGLLALLGWLTNQSVLTTWAAATVPMAPVTALLAVLLGAALVLCAPSQPRSSARRAARVIAGAGAAATLGLWLMRLVGWLPRFELLGLPVTGAIGGARIGFISPITAACFLVADLTLLGLIPPVTRTGWKQVARRAAAAALVGTGFTLVVGNVLGAPLLVGLATIPVSFGASAVVFVSGLALWVLAGRSHATPLVAAPVRPFVWIFVAVVAVIMGGGYAYYRQLERELRADIEHQLEAVAELKVATLNQWRRERLGDANLLFRSASITGLLRRVLLAPGDGAARRRLREWFRSYDAYLQYDRMYVFDADGTVRASLPVSDDQPSVIISTQVSSVLRTGRVAVQDFYRDERDGRVHLAVVVPIVGDGEGAPPIGALSLRIDPTLFLFPFIERWPGVSASAETLLVRRDGDHAQHLNDLRFAPGAALRLRVPLAKTENVSVKAALGETGTLEGVDYKGAPALAVARAIPDSPWHLVARIDLAEFHAQLWQRLRVVSAFGGLLLLSAGSGLGLAWRNQRLAFYRERSALATDLGATAAQLRELLDNSPTIVYALENVDGELSPTAVSGNIERILGYTTAEVLQPSFWLSHVHPEDRSKAVAAMAALDTSDGMSHEYRFVRKDGSELWVMDRLNVTRRDARGPVAVAGSWHDVTERKHQELRARRLTQLYAALSQCNEAIVRSTSAAELFPRICEAAVSDGGMAMAWVGLTNEATLMVDPVASFGAGTGYLDGIQISVCGDSPLGQGPTGTSIRENRAVWVEDFRTDPRTQAWHERARGYGWAASAGLPLTREGRAVGALTIYATTPDAFDADGRRLLNEMATDISFALDTFAREAHRRGAEEAVRASLHEKEALLMEVHHRVKNNLQVISSLLRLEAGRSARLEVTAVLAEMQSRVMSMALLHETLYRSGNLAAVDLAVYLSQLGNQIVRSLAPASGVTLHLDVDPISIELEQAVPCGLLVNELISNALKHAFPDGRRGDIRIEAHPLNGGPEIRLVVSDSGIGLPADFEEARQRSLGLQLVADLARQLRGTLNIQAGARTTFTLTFVPRTTAGAPSSRSVS